MYDHKLPSRQLAAWLTAAIVPTVIQLTAGGSWLLLLPASVLCLVSCWLRWSFGTEPKGKLLLILQWILAAVVLGRAAQCSIQSWPSGAHPAVAVVLLLLAAWSALKGNSAAARVGCVIFWFVLLLYLTLLGAGVKDVNPKWLLPTHGEVDAFGCVLLLTPAAAAIYLCNKGSFAPKLVLIGVLCILASLITAGVLSPQVASVKPNAFYEMTRSLNLLGQARRFEAVLSAGMTMGWFLVFSLFLTISAKLVQEAFHIQGKWGILGSILTALTIVLCEMHISGVLLLVFCAIFWVFLPLLTQWIDAIKKVGKK